MLTIDELRRKIEQTDALIIKKLAERRTLAQHIGQLKLEEGKEIIDLSQEQKLFNFYEKLCKKHHLQTSFIKKLFRIIIDYSREVQK